MHLNPVRRDDEATRLRQFSSPDSYVSHRIHPGTTHPCVYLAGKDAAFVRSVIFEKYGSRCFWCAKWVPFDGPVTVRGHLCHVGGSTKVERCWCVEALRLGCYECHILEEHAREPRWTQ